jgi:hypothetical protein
LARVRRIPHPKGGVMADPLVTGEEFMEKYAHLKVELMNGRVTLSGRPIDFVDGRIQCADRPPKPLMVAVKNQPPQLVVETVSSSNTRPAIFRKVGEYLGIGVPAVLVLAPQTRTAHLYHRETGPQILREADTLTLPDVLPGFAVPVARFFA